LITVPGAATWLQMAKTNEILPILITPHPSLRRRARTVGPGDDATVRALVPRMLATMYDAPGIGLAAPQVNVDLRLVVVDLMPNDTPNPLTLINPQIVSASQERAIREEGCLSVPGQYADVSRPAQVKLRYHDIEGVRHEIEAEGLLAACLQHELDHLDGVLFVDYLTPLKRNILLRRLAKDLKQKAAG
jgi:peptide deformylase